MKKIYYLLILLVLFIPLTAFAEGENLTIDSVTFFNKSENAEEVNPPSIVNGKLNFALKFYTVGDYANYKVVVTNTSDVNLSVANNSITSSNDYVGYEVTSENDIIKPGEEATLNVQVYYKEQVPKESFMHNTYDATGTGSFDLAEKIISVPNTLKNIGILGLCLLIVTGSCLLVGLFVIVKDKNQSNVLLILIAFMLFPILGNATVLVEIPIESTVTIKKAKAITCEFGGTIEANVIYSPEGQYKYIYESGSGGWKVELKDKDSTAPVTDPICSVIDNIPLKSMQGTYYNSKATSIDVSSVDTSEVISFYQTFANTTNLSEIDISNFDTRNSNNFMLMFDGSGVEKLDLHYIEFAVNTSRISSIVSNTPNLTEVNMDGWDISKTDSSSGNIFFHTYALKKVSARYWTMPASFTHKISRAWGGGVGYFEEFDATGWNTSATTDLTGAFANSTAMKKLIGINTWNMSSLTNISQMILGCDLVELDLSGMDLSGVTNASAMLTSNPHLEKLVTPANPPAATTIDLPVTMYAKGDSTGITQITSSTPANTVYKNAPWD